jgi:8-oxo-dGTP diphosphatase
MVLQRPVKGGAPEVLLAQRPGANGAAGEWEFPGGKVRPGESLAAALRREISEELGLVVSPGYLLDRVVGQSRRGRWICLHFLAATILRGRPQALEHTEIRWVPWAEVGGYALSATDREFVSRHRHR